MQLHLFNVAAYLEYFNMFNSGLSINKGLNHTVRYWAYLVAQVVLSVVAFEAKKFLLF